MTKAPKLDRHCALVVGTPAGTHAVAAPVMAEATAVDDPIFAAIEEREAALELLYRLYDEISATEFQAGRAHGERPWTQIAWRKYSSIGGLEIDRAKNEFWPFLILIAIKSNKNMWTQRPENVLLNVRPMNGTFVKV